MSLEKNGSVLQIDYCLPLLSFNLLGENEMKKCFDWINLTPMSSTKNNSKKAKIDSYLYILPEVKEK